VDGRVVVFPSTSPNELRVTVYDPLRGVPVAELEVRKSSATGKHLSSWSTTVSVIARVATSLTSSPP
jgi:hypothetical protein